jgi:glycosyltransferase involved in cell wall biosynthesis
MTGADGNTGADLRVSLVVPMRDEADSIAALVESIAGQTRKPDEVLLVDGGSSDGTVALARALTARYPEFRVLEPGPATPGRGRNVGIAAARHDWIALTDAGIRLERTWLERLVEVAHRDPTLGVIYGNFEPVTDSLFTHCAALAYVPPKGPRGDERMRGPSIASALIRKRVWDAVGGFPDLRAAEDLIFMRRIEQAGVSIGWAPGATVWWQLRPTLGATYRKFVSYSRANVRAGLQRNWHHGIARQYLLALPFLALAAYHRAWWVAIPAAGFAARVARSLWRRRERHGLFWLANPAQFALVAAIVAVVDLATFVGWAQERLASHSQGHGVPAEPLPLGAPHGKTR